MENDLSPAPIQNLARQPAIPGGHCSNRITYITSDIEVLALLDRAAMIAPTMAPILITGESGTGKDVLARYIHDRSGRTGAPMVAVNCAALPHEVIDNELFGHEREAFTGANSRKAGCFEMAHRGTLFLDEIGEMPPGVQAKLLRALETKRFRRLGGTEEIEVDVRILSATNRDIGQALASGQLREDVYYRLRVADIHLPPLRSRPGDIPLLLDHFLGTFAASMGRERQLFHDDAMEILLEYRWPGNIRELRNVVEAAVITCPGNVICPQHLPERMTRAHTIEKAITIPAGCTILDAEHLMIEYTLAVTRGNKSKTAQILGVSRKYLYERLSEMNGKKKLRE
jgi:DNA-binding NtrC family response regulator